jgi:hypothetical protein
MSSFWDTSLGWAIKLSAWVMLFLAPVKASMAAIVFLVLSDLVFGVWAALKRGEKFNSAALRRTPVKLTGYLAGIVLAFVAETYLLPELPIVKVVGGLAASTELVSLFESLSTISGIPFQELAKRLFNKQPGQPPAGE